MFTERMGESLEYKKGKGDLTNETAVFTGR